MPREISRWHHLTRADGLNPVVPCGHPFDAASEEIQEEEEEEEEKEAAGAAEDVTGAGANWDEYSRMDK